MQTRKDTAMITKEVYQDHATSWEGHDFDETAFLYFEPCIIRKGVFVLGIFWVFWPAGVYLGCFRRCSCARPVCESYETRCYIRWTRVNGN